MTDKAKKQISNAIAALRRTEKEILYSTDWQDKTCRDHQIDTAELKRRIHEKSIQIPLEILRAKHG